MCFHAVLPTVSESVYTDVANCTETISGIPVNVDVLELSVLEIIIIYSKQSSENLRQAQQVETYIEQTEE